MRRVVFFDHLDAGTAVLSNLVDVGTLHKAQADVRMPQTVGCTGSAFAVEMKILLIKDSLEKFALPLRKNKVRRSGRSPLSVVPLQRLIDSELDSQKTSANSAYFPFGPGAELRMRLSGSVKGLATETGGQ